MKLVLEDEAAAVHFLPALRYGWEDLVSGRRRMTRDGRVEEVGRAIAQGRALLLLGQRHSVDVIENATADLGAVLHAQPADTLPQQYFEIGTVEKACQASRAYDAQRPSAELETVAANPWSAVLTTAVDPGTLAAFQRSSGPGRQIRVLFAGAIASLSGAPSPMSLNFVRLAGAADEESESQLPPLSEFQLRQRRLISISPLLAQLPATLGPHSILVVAGLGDDDWLDLDTLQLALSGRLPEGAIHWFPAYGREIDPQRLKAAFGESVVLHAEPLAAALEGLSGSQVGELLETSRETTFHPVEQVITVWHRSGAKRAVTLSPSDARNVGRVLQVLDDATVRAPRPFGKEEDRQRFRDFLRRPQHVPDWQGVARGYLFERADAPAIAERIEAELKSLGSVLATDKEALSGVRVTSTRMPWLLCAPPASGKSRLLHWLIFELRSRGYCSVWCTPGPGRLSLEPVGRACRLLQSAGARPLIVGIDDLEGRDYVRLADYLASLGINCLVLGALNVMLEPGCAPDDAAPDSIASDPVERLGAKMIQVHESLSPDEAKRLVDFVGDRGFSDASNLASSALRPLFLLWLHAMLPDSRTNIRRSIEAEYERLMHRLDSIDTGANGGEATADWQDALRQLRDSLFPEEPAPEAPRTESVLAHSQLFRDVVDTCLMCAQLGMPAPLNVLLRAYPTLLGVYGEFAREVGATAILQEVDVDGEGTSALDTHHPLVAELLLQSLVSDRAQQLRCLRPLLRSITWVDNAFPGETPEQDYLVAVLRTAARSAERGKSFSSRDCLEELVAMLSEVREAYGANLPNLLLLEGKFLRLLADRHDTDTATCIQLTTRAMAVLDTAESILDERRPSHNRNSQLQNILTTKAATVGYALNVYLRDYAACDEQTRRSYREKILASLEEVNRLTARASSIGGAGFYPYDVNFWNHRDVLVQLPDLSEEEQIQLLSKLAAILQDATEVPIEPTQLGRFETRQATLKEIEGDTVASEEIAARLRDRGDYSAEVVLVRSRVFDPGAMVARSPSLAADNLARLEGYGSGVYGDPSAVSLMNRLWMNAFLPTPLLSSEEPVMAACRRDTWARWQRILEARIQMPEGRENPYVGFCLAWVYFQLGQPGNGAETLRANERLSIGHRWRVGALAVLTDESGGPIQYMARVRSRSGSRAIMYVPELMTEVRLDLVSGSRDLPLELRIGHELTFPVGINYSSLVPWWESAKDHAGRTQT